MSNKKKTVVMEKDGVEAEVTQAQFKGLAKRGWTVVDDGDSETNQAQAQEVEELEQQEQRLFGADDKEN